MGLFARSKSPQLPVDASGRTLWSPAESERRALFTYTEERRSTEGIAAVDTQSFLESGWAHQLGLPEDAPRIAWGEALLGWPLGSDQVVQAQAVVSTEWLVLWWQATRRRIDGLLVNLQLVTAVDQRTGPMFDIELMDAMALDAGGQRMTGPSKLVVCVAPSRDGQAVRRSVEVVYTLVGQAAVAAGLEPQEGRG